MPHPPITVRKATDDDRPAVVALCRESLGWHPDDPNEAFFEWKHDENPFGRSPAWIAESEGRAVGVRVFLRWRFRDRDGTVRSAVRAVDTATHPDAQGRGIFTKLTLGALPDLRANGVAFIFNTPNSKSRPGYLKMGWGDVGTVPVAVRVAGPRRLAALAGARTAAAKWSEPTDYGSAVTDAFEDTAAVSAILDRPARPCISTDRDSDYLRWRYSFAPLHYRVVPFGRTIADGMAVFRLRRRGAALEATISELIGPAAAARRVIGGLLDATGADYAIVGAGGCIAGCAERGFLPVPQLGPQLTWKPITLPGVPRRADLSLALGDVELF